MGLKRTTILSMGSEGWKLLGPSSQRYPSLSTVMMFPPTRSLASVTITFGATALWLVASAWAMQRPLIPPPIITQSAVAASAALRFGLNLDGEILDSSAIEHRSLRGSRWMRSFSVGFKGQGKGSRDGVGRRSEMSVNVNVGIGTWRRRRNSRLLIVTVPSGSRTFCATTYLLGEAYGVHTHTKCSTSRTLYVSLTQPPFWL